MVQIKDYGEAQDRLFRVQSLLKAVRDGAQNRAQEVDVEQSDFCYRIFNLTEIALEHLDGFDPFIEDMEQKARQGK
jgi:hypothetical protein